MLAKLLLPAARCPIYPPGPQLELTHNPNPVHLLCLRSISGDERWSLVDDAVEKQLEKDGF